ncbi:hypothetical protein [Trichormus variabilis]|uniref:SPOR domain-containing protein n=1 Tax=Trichormus variabilis SAG 1403-4b TaxID=447716 RepID=A0A433UVM9_ANAVA|nr:hypothetical protein [Trichormus variabilis]MBD2627692.1 hypothetical protein [Trichormus variabilis FACHB-164]RUS97924.1 hypothetical protein DSM107003_17990 [Trichormus variabilis SAG 1403-4b]
MSQNPIIDSGTQSSKTPGLKPALALSLASLEVQLDQELTRYRRTRNALRQPKQFSTESYSPNQSPHLKGMTATVGNTQPSVAEVNTNAISWEKPAEEDTPDQNYLQMSSTPESIKPPTPPAPKSLSSSSLVPTKIQAAESENILPTEDPPQHPDDYLESSEALLRSLKEKPPQPKKSSPASDSLLSPLGIGSMLLLLLASLMLGYVVLNPKTWPLNKGKFTNNSSLPSAQNPQEINNAQPVAVPEITSIPKYPDLAAREFPKVRDPNDVVALKPKVQLTPTIIPKPITIQPSLKPVLPLTSVPLVTPIPEIQKPETLPTPNGEIKPSADGFYYVVIDNKGDGALAKARQVVSDAYLSPNQKYIYLGALKTKDEVKLRLQQLQAKGIQARIQQ